MLPIDDQLVVEHFSRRWESNHTEMPYASVNASCA